jgi:hypothetical protein
VNYQDFYRSQVSVYELTENDLDLIVHQIPESKNQILKREFLEKQRVTYETKDGTQIRLVLTDYRVIN